uniref:ATP-citrate synthase citrate-binding domain-containing protein n=1 Tax=Ananas comosus var. bracteatus TaxID=296719 RepID=A0A6V7P7J3_ANACO|nr:unnamed protein product [Ananas comosus var. bracteatus]
MATTAAATTTTTTTTTTTMTTPSSPPASSSPSPPGPSSPPPSSPAPPSPSLATSPSSSSPSSAARRRGSAAAAAEEEEEEEEAGSITTSPVTPLSSSGLLLRHLPEESQCRGPRYQFTACAERDAAGFQYLEIQVASTKLSGWRLGFGFKTSSNGFGWDNYLEEAMKMRNLLDEFRANHGLRPPTILGVQYLANPLFIEQYEPSTAAASEFHLIKEMVLMPLHFGDHFAICPSGELFEHICNADLDFTFLEMNPFTLVDGKPYPLDMRGELDDTAAFKNFKKWRDIEFPMPFGRVMSPTESFVHKPDEKTLMSPYLNTYSGWDLGYASELGNYVEYSGAPKEEEVLHGIIRALREKESNLKASRMHVFVSRGGPNYQTGLRKMRHLGEEIGIPIENSWSCGN